MHNLRRHSGGSGRVANRRLHLRRGLSSLAYVELNEDSRCIAFNLGEGGLGVQPSTVLVEKNLPRISFQLPQSGKWVKLSGKIAWIGESRKEAGILFIDLPETARIEIGEWVSAGPSIAAFPEERASVNEHVSLRRVSLVLALAIVSLGLMWIAFSRYAVPPYMTVTTLLRALQSRMVAAGWLAVLALLVGYGGWLYRKSAQTSREIRVALAMLPVMVFSLASKLVGNLLYLPLVDWNALRLVPTFALTRGAGLYTGVSDDPVLGFIYGPVTAIIYLPTVLASTPTAAVFIGGMITLFISLLPLILCLLPAAVRNEKDRIASATALLFAIGALLYMPGTFAAVTSIHADAPAFGLGLLSLAVVSHGKGSSSNVRLGLSALFAVLAVWAKQIEAPLLVGIAVYLWVAHGRKPLLRFIAWTASIGIAVTGLSCAAFGLQKMAFNMWTIPAHHPWQGGPKSYQFLLSLRQFFAEGSFLFVIVLSEIINSWRVADGRTTRCRKEKVEFLRSNSWTLPLLVALFMIPTSVMGAAKVGGTHNSYHAYYYLVAACAIIFRDWLSSSTAERNSFPRVAASILLLTTVSFVAGNVYRVYNDFPSSPSSYSYIWQNPQEQAFTYDRRHPGEVYFAWNPLSSFMAEGKLYHSADGILARKLAGYPVSQAQLHSYLPARMRYIAYYSDSRYEVCCDYLPEYSKRVNVPELPGWFVYERQYDSGRRP
jgi:hypothetical protein